MNVLLVGAGAVGEAIAVLAGRIDPKGKGVMTPENFPAERFLKRMETLGFPRPRWRWSRSSRGRKIWRA